ncbi:MAG: carboxypeptidase M32 [Erysipelotrichaceae bacterium]
MNKEERIQQYFTWQKQLNAYALAINTMSYERQTFSPMNGRAYSAEMESILMGEYYNVATDKSAIENMKALIQEEIEHDLKVEVVDRLKEIDHIACIPADEYMAFSKLQSECEMAWADAKEKNDYAKFKPLLQSLVETVKKNIGYRAEPKSVYEVLLNDFEKGMTIEKYDAFFALIEEKLIPFIKRLMGSETFKNQYFKLDNVAISAQEKVSEHLLKYLKYDETWGCLHTSAHPFSSSFSLNDCRITTKYDEEAFTSNIYSIIHEVGHATYEHQASEKYEGRHIREMIGSGMHESQSRLLENYIGRSASFWEVNYPLIQQEIDYLKEVDKQDFVRYVNEVKPSLIRVDADELTYPLHVLIRYKIEKEMFDQEIDFDELPQKWNQYVKDYLGVDVPSDTQGLLQDVHWAMALFGYFPTYALGSAYAAQFMHQMHQDLDVDAILEKGNLQPILDWLKENIHQYGGLYTANEVLEKVTGEVFNPNYYIDYLIDKYSRYYQL